MNNPVIEWLTVPDGKRYKRYSRSGEILPTTSAETGRPHFLIGKTAAGWAIVSGKAIAEQYKWPQ
jgi:hypothetical protein